MPEVHSKYTEKLAETNRGNELKESFDVNEFVRGSFSVSWLLGGNPVLDAVWLFANGVICIQQGYKFFMIALEDQEDAQRIVREIKGLLPAAATA